MPTVVGVLLPFFYHSAAQAEGRTDGAGLQVAGPRACVTQHYRSYCVTRINQSPAALQKAQEIGADFQAGVVFTDEESDAAVQRFGCDCPACIRAIKQIRSLVANT